jgi:hypothetical protein
MCKSDAGFGPLLQISYGATDDDGNNNITQLGMASKYIGDKGNHNDNAWQNPIYYPITVFKETDPAGNPVISVEKPRVTAALQALNAAPNPVTSTTQLSYALNGTGNLGIYSLSGQRVKSFRGLQGTGSICWDGRDALGKPVCAGVYIAKLQAPAGNVTLRLLLTK